jgi:hypothetical protein
MTNNESEVVEILHRVESWPQTMRISLARQILQSLEEGQRQTPRGQSAAEVLALLKSDKPAPDDATVKKWLDEHRLEKYGQ